MKTRNLGHTGVQVSEYCLGTMMFGKWGNSDHGECARIIRTAIDAGINFVDTADIYSGGEAEKILGKALKGCRDDVVVATKVHGRMGKGVNRRGNSRLWIMRAVEASLRRLETDWIDLYQLHRPEESTSIDDTLGALSDLVHQGKVRYIGTSEFPAEQIVEAQWASERRRRERPICEQLQYSILARRAERDILPTCRRHGVGAIAWSPLGGGYLAGKYRTGADVPPDSRSGRGFGLDLEDPPQRQLHEQRVEIAQRLERVASDAGCSLAHLSLAFVLENPAVSAAIIGPRTLDQLQDLLDGADTRLDAAILDRIDAIVDPGTNSATLDAWRTAALKPQNRRGGASGSRIGSWP